MPLISPVVLWETCKLMIYGSDRFLYDFQKKYFMYGYCHMKLPVHKF